ncbi:MAG: 4-phosphopantetheinyl transferase [Frankiaceae bacterium]|jgi:4'-phosphopantetheinyl transferase|nr:4-phosphopantetheinyl transferase [Frankiaceae bacterium]
MTTASLATAAQVDVLAVRLSDVVRPADGQLLSADERARSSRFRFTRDRGRYVSGRAELRRLLGARLGCGAAEVEFAYGPAGKPSIPGTSLQFNASHSADVALFVVADGADAVGVDIELPRPGFGGVDIARRFFAPGEVARLLALPAQQRDDAFLRCWTRKEALLKAHGGGLSLPLHDFEVSLEPAQPASIVQLGPTLAGRAWHLYDVSDCWPGSYAAVAVDSTVPVSITSKIPEEGNQ